MKYLYTTKPDETCHEVEPGIWGRPAHTTEQAKLRKKGWVYNVNDLKEADHGLRKTEEEGRKEKGQVVSSREQNREMSKLLSSDPLGSRVEETEEEVSEEMARIYEEVIGKKPHHKMKFETMKAKIDEALKDE